MTEHTKEPWVTYQDEDTGEICIKGVNDEVCNCYNENMVRVESDATHIVSCVNNLEGLNPDAISEVVEALRVTIDLGETILKNLAHEPFRKSIWASKSALANLTGETK